MLADNWNIQLATITSVWACLAAVLTRRRPGIPGDSGSAFFDGKGLASGVLSTLQFAPVVGANGVGYLSKELAYARTFSDFGSLGLALGTEAFAVRVRRSIEVDRLTFAAALDRLICLSASPRAIAPSMSIGSPFQPPSVVRAV